MGLGFDPWNLVAVVAYVAGVAATHVVLRRPWMTWSAALIAVTVDGVLVPFGAVAFGLVALATEVARRVSGSRTEPLRGRGQR